MYSSKQKRTALRRYHKCHSITETIRGWVILTAPNAMLVNTMLDQAIATLSPDEHPVIRKDRGCHYRWPGWIERMEHAELTRSMSKKGCFPDHSACKGLFGRIKNEMVYNQNWTGVLIETFVQRLNEYLVYHNTKRLRLP
ncbi:Mobile element protein [Clostridiaceae bacterium JG1575]|nr:Mobile element protein [Clostridiaceae bacterium JG1575]